MKENAVYCIHPGEIEADCLSLLAGLLDAATDQGTLLGGIRLGRLQSLLLLLLLCLEGHVVLVEVLAFLLGCLQWLLFTAFASRHSALLVLLEK